MRLGIIGTLIWDRIFARDVRTEPFQEWGGIAYALAAADAARPDGWTIVPILKVGADLQEHAFQFLRTLNGFDLESGIRVVEEPNNRVELRYQDNERRAELMSGGVPGWSWDELAPIVGRVDALYVNFISGFELDLANAVRLRLSYHGPMYADLHSMMLGVDPTGLRVPQPLYTWREWVRCFDAIQVNEDELGMLAAAWNGDPWHFAAQVVGDELKVLLVTLASRGAVYVASPAFRAAPMQWRPKGIVVPPVTTTVEAHSKKIPPAWAPQNGDPTGCGDVWGATCFCRLLSGATLDDAMTAANAAAARNVQHRGATGLNRFLRGRIHS